jgi:DNA polymerase-3 subunit gamma/tau
MRGQAERYGRPSLSRAADVMATALVDMRGTTSPRLVLELACARVLLPGAASDTSALLARLDTLERRISAGVVAPSVVVDGSPPEPAVVAAPAAPAPEPSAEVAPDPEPDGAAAPAPVEAASGDSPAAAPSETVGSLDLAGLRRLWDAVLDAVKQRSRTAHALMLSSQIESLEGTTLVLAFKTPTLATRFANDVADFVTEALREVVGVDLVLRATSGGSTPAGSPASAVALSSPSEPPTAADKHVSTEFDPDDDGTDPEAEVGADVPFEDPADAALALVKEGLGGQVIGEIDRS